MVEYIEISGVKYPILINFYVIGLFQQETGLSFNILTDIQNNLYIIEPLLYHSIKVGQIVSKVPVTITREDMPILLSDNNLYIEFPKLISKFFPSNSEPDSGKKKKI